MEKPYKLHSIMEKVSWKKKKNFRRKLSKRDDSKTSKLNSLETVVARKVKSTHNKSLVSKMDIIFLFYYNIKNY